MDLFIRNVVLILENEKEDTEIAWQLLRAQEHLKVNGLTVGSPPLVGRVVPSDIDPSNTAPEYLLLGQHDRTER